MAHAVQLFDSDDSLSLQVAAFLHRGFLHGERLCVVATSEHMAGIARHLSNLGCPVTEAVASGRLKWLDAVSTLQMLMPEQRLDASHLRSLVRDLAPPPSDPHAPIRIYGEMVSLLAERGDLRGAMQLEQAWNRAPSGAPVSMLCGYMSSHFGDPATSGALHEICQLHDEVRRCNSDLLGSWLVERHSASGRRTDSLGP